LIRVSLTRHRGKKKGNNFFWDTEAAFHAGLLVYNLMSVFANRGSAPRAAKLVTMRVNFFGYNAWVGQYGWRKVLWVNVSPCPLNFGQGSRVF